MFLSPAANVWIPPPVLDPAAETRFPGLSAVYPVHRCIICVPGSALLATFCSVIYSHYVENLLLTSPLIWVLFWAARGYSCQHQCAVWMTQIMSSVVTFTGSCTVLCLVRFKKKNSQSSESVNMDDGQSLSWQLTQSMAHENEPIHKHIKILLKAKTCNVVTDLCILFLWDILCVSPGEINQMNSYNLS